MKTKTLTQIFSLFALSTTLNATTWHVGPGQTYTAPSQVSTLVNNGDTVNIDDGTYEADVCAWNKNNLLLRCTNGMAHLKANNTSFGGKAIWVIQGNNTRVEHIEFSLGTNPDGNGAGIRLEGHDLVVQNCYFHDNQNGILTTAISPCRVLIEYSEFKANGTDDGFSHNLYIGQVDSLIFRYNYTHLCKGGNLLKSRANVNYILYNRFSDEATGTASQEIDLPNGGMAIVMGNIIQKGTGAQNSNMINYGGEGLTNSPPHNLYLVNNTMVNERVNGGTFVNVKSGTNIYKSYNNIFAGTGSLLSGGATTLDSLKNKNYTLLTSLFVNSVAYDYHLTVSASAINSATVAGNASNGFALTPAFEYSHPANKVPRMALGQQDAGAYEYSTPNAIKSETLKNNLAVYLSENYIVFKSTEELSSVKITAVDGKTIYESKTLEPIAADQLPVGVYVISAVLKNGAVVTKKMLIQ